jgi:predicted nucleic acid-binding protein
VALASLASYDGSAGVLVDTNVWVDCIDAASPWHEWAVKQLQVCSERSPLQVDVYGTLRTSLPWAAASLTAAAYATYLRRGGAKHKPLPDFFIGAHAAVSNLSVLTRDPKPYKSYFAKLEVIAP